MSQIRIERVLLWLGVLGVYFLLARFGLEFATVKSHVSPIWPASGFAAAVLVRFGWSYASAIFLGVFFANYLIPSSPLAALMIAVGNTAEGLAAAYILRRLERPLVHSLFDETAGYLAASIFPSALAATMGTLALTFSGIISIEQSLAAWTIWLTGDALGILTLTPLLLMRSARTRPNIWTERFFIYVALTAALYFAFGRPTVLLSAFWLFPILLLTAMRLEEIDIKLLTFLAVAASVCGTLVGSGPFQSGNVAQNLTSMQVFMFTIGITGLSLANFRRAGSMLYPACAVCLTWALTAAVCISIQSGKMEQDRQHFDKLADGALSHLQTRLQIFENVLHGGVALFASSLNVDRKEWTQFVQSVRLEERHPGVRGMGVIFPVERKNAARLNRAFVRDGFPQIQIRPLPWAKPDPHLPHYVVTFVEPIEANWQAFGVDIASDPARRYAADLARVTRGPVLSSKLKVITEPEKQAYLMLHPVMRNERFIGWVYMVFRGDEFFPLVFADVKQELEVLVFDGNDHLQQAQQPVFASHGWNPDRPIESFRTLEIAHHRFNVGLRRSAGFHSSLDTTVTWVAAVGTLISLLIAALIAGLQSVNRRAEQIALEKTAQLAESEAKVRQALEMRERSALEASRLKTEFLANMSHEIRTPINGIVGMTKLLCEGPLSNEQRGFANRIHEASQLLMSLINDILDLSKVEAGKMDLEIIPFRMGRVILETQELFFPLAREKGLDFQVELDPAADKVFAGDPNRIRQLLNNLIGNALKFTPAGRISLSCKRIESQNRISILEIVVSDTGIGIKPEFSDRLFQSFTQADPSTARKFGGTGLGLAICKRLCDLMDGSITVESEEKRGTTFRIRLPLEDLQDSALPPPQPFIHRATALNVDRRRCRILVAEDNAINLEISLRTLQRAGYQVDQATDGLEVVEKLKHKSFDLILMDCQMPFMDGFEATRAIRQKGNNVPIVALTANAFREGRERCIEAGMSDYLAKPVDDRELIACVDYWVEPRLRSNEAILDEQILDRLKDLARDSDPDLLDRLVNMFGDSIEANMMRLRQMSRVGGPTLSKAAHALRSGPSSLGAHRVSDLLVKLEGGEFRPEQLEDLLNLIESEYRLAHRELQKHIPDGKLEA